MVKYGIIALMCLSQVEAKIAKVGNAGLATKGGHKAHSLPKSWKLTGKKNKVSAWNLGGSVGSVVSLSTGAELKTKVEMAPLSDQEKKVKGDWSGLLMVDAYGCEKRGGGKFTVLVEQNGKALIKKTFKVGEVALIDEAEKKKIVPQRRWLVLNKQIVSKMMTGACEVKLIGASQNPVVLGGVEICRLHESPTRRLEAKPNGKAGPDKVNVASLGFNMLVEHMQRVATVYNVRKGSIAEKAGLQNGDVIAGINGEPLSVNNANPGWQWFNNGHAATLGNAILNGLEGDKASKNVKLSIFRKGSTSVVTLPLVDVYLGKDFFLKPDGDKMRQDMIGYLLKHQKADGSFGCPIRTTFAALSLLAEKDQKYASQIFKAVNWMLKRYPNAEKFGNLGYWHSAYAGILYCEYYLATGDKRVLPRMQAIHDWVMTGVHTSKWGMACLGHGTNGLPYGNKALMAPASHLLVFDGLAQKCGLHTQLWTTLRPYMEHCWSDPAKGGHGSMGYNASYKDKAQFWSRTGQSALACAIRGEDKVMQDAMTKFMAANYPYYRNSHAYGEPGGAWGIISLALTRPAAYNNVMNKLRWEFALSWEPGFGMRFSQPHMGAPYMGTDDLVNAAYPLVFSSHKQTLFITGATEKNWLDVSKLKIPVSDVVLRQHRDGKAWLESVIPGNRIVYTTDGSEPSASSTEYTTPFEVENGGVVKAMTIVDGKQSKVTERTYDAQSNTIKVIAASGHKDSAEALRRAGFSIDGARYYAWIPDRGQGATSYPHYVVYDLGAYCKVDAIKFLQGKGKAGVGECKVYGGVTEAEVMPKGGQTSGLLGEATWTSVGNLCEVKLNQPTEEVRYLRVEFTKPVDEAQKGFKIEELKVYSTVVRELPKPVAVAPKPSQTSEPETSKSSENKVAPAKKSDASTTNNDTVAKQVKQDDPSKETSEVKSAAQNTWVHYAVLGGLIALCGFVYTNKK